MKVFEDLLVELKEENLLEETVDFLPIPNGNGSAKAKPQTSNGNGNGNGNGHKNGSAAPKQKQTEAGAKKRNIKKDRASLADQLSALQLVDLVVSAAERLDGVAGLPFDELKVQKSLHRYTQAASDPESDEYLEAESALHDSLQAWEQDLIKRDEALPVGSLRRYTESANPPLSPQALFALVRFYRTVPFSDSALFKFDFVVTRLFSKFIDAERREMLCSRSDAVKHLNQRYSKWGVNAFNSLPSDDPDVSLACLSFDEFAAEAESASTLASLIGSKFFERLHEMKRNLGELSFVPRVTSVAIDSNLKISAKLFDLAPDTAELTKLAGIDAELVSRAIARTFEANATGDSSSRNTVNNDDDERKPITIRSVQSSKTKAKSVKRSGRSGIFGINPWLLLATILTVVISSGIYVWSQYYAEDSGTATLSAHVIEIDKPELRQYIKTAKITSDMLHAVVTPEYLGMALDKRRDVLQQVRALGDSKGYRRVTFYDAEGKTVAFASVDRTEIH